MQAPLCAINNTRHKHRASKPNHCKHTKREQGASMKAAAVIVALAVLCMAMLASAQQNSERCPGLQECRLTYTVNEFVFKFDLNPLCSDVADYR